MTNGIALRDYALAMKYPRVLSRRLDLYSIVLVCPFLIIRLRGVRVVSNRRRASVLPIPSVLRFHFLLLRFTTISVPISNPSNVGRL